MLLKRHSSVVFFYLAFALLLASSYQSGGLSFNEVMQGYFSNGDVSSYEEAYEKGKENEQQIFFSLHAIIPDMNFFLADENHVVGVNGSVHLLQNAKEIINAQVLEGSFIELFEHGVQVNKTLYMRYFLKYADADGSPLHLDGFKEVKGTKCADVFKMMTTLYVHVREGHQRDQGTILQTGMVVIDLEHVVQFAMSFRGYKTHSAFDFLHNLEMLLAFFAKNIEDDCTPVFDAFKTKFWYIWVSDGSRGFLLDVIKRPDRAEIRLDVYEQTLDPVVVRQYLSLTDFNVTNDIVKIGDLVLSQSACNGVVQQDDRFYQFNDLNFSLLKDHVMEFVPSWLENVVRVLPDVKSRYGAYLSGSLNKMTFASGLPMVYTTYTVFGMGFWRWSMISGMKFEKTDLQFEGMATSLEGVWVASSYLYYNGKQHVMNNPLLQQTKLLEAGEFVAEDGFRHFAMEVKDSPVLPKLHLKIACKAVEKQFAILEQEGKTFIHTTVLGSCEATDLVKKTVFTSSSALLEVKI